MTFTVLPLTISPTDRTTTVERTARTKRRDAFAATAQMIHEVESGRSFLLGGVRDSGKTSLLNEVCLHFNRQVDQVVALGPLSLGLVSQDGLNSLGSQLRKWCRDNETRLPYTLPSSYQPTHADSLEAWLPFLTALINQQNADTLLLLLDDLDRVLLEDREAILRSIQDSSWAKIAGRMVLGCAENLLDDEIPQVTLDEPYASWRSGPQDTVAVGLKRETAEDLLNALIINLGALPDGKKKAKGYKDGSGKKSDPSKYSYGRKDRYGKAGKPGKPLGGGKPTGGGKPRAEAAIKEEVNATVYAPNQASPRDSFVVEVFAHRPRQASGLKKIAKEAEPDTEKRGGTTLTEKIRRGDKLTFKLDMAGLQIDKPAKSLIWQGKRRSVKFKVIVPKNFKPGKITGTVEMWGNSAAIGDLVFSFKILTETAAGVPETQPVGKVKQYKHVFVSYASKDLSEVEKITLTWDSRGVNYFMARKHLKSGDEWQKVIPQKIDKSDAFYLFWSNAASESTEVGKEFMYAIERQAESCRTTPGPGENPPNEAPRIYPFRIEAPPACPEWPPELAHIHFEE